MSLYSRHYSVCESHKRSLEVPSALQKTLVSSAAVADFRQGGVVAVDGDQVKIFMKTAESCSVHSLSTLPVTLSGPAAVLGLTDLSTFLTLCSCTVNGGERSGVGVG